MTAHAQTMPRRPQPRLLGAAAAAVLAVAAVVVAILLIGGGSGSSAPVHHELTYGGLPKWLPKTEKTEERIVTASATHPALAIQGNTVAVELPHGGKVMATAVGPEVPEEGEFPVPATSPASFVVTLAKAHGAVPIKAGDFTVRDEEGHIHHPKVTGLHGGPLPSEVAAGKTVSLEVRGTFPTGDGALNWAPGSGKPIVAWDFDIEID
jgi:hypothetical protein